MFGSGSNRPTQVSGDGLIAAGSVATETPYILDRKPTIWAANGTASFVPQGDFPDDAPGEVETPGVETIEALAQFLDIDPAATSKAMPIVKADGTLVLALVAPAIARGWLSALVLVVLIVAGIEVVRSIVLRESRQPA